MGADRKLALALARIARKIVRESKPLPTEEAEILYRNRWDLYIPAATPKGGVK